jgi:hypothetical protein
MKDEELKLRDLHKLYTGLTVFVYHEEIMREVKNFVVLG